MCDLTEWFFNARLFDILVYFIESIKFYNQPYIYSNPLLLFVVVKPPAFVSSDSSDDDDDDDEDEELEDDSELEDEAEMFFRVLVKTFTIFLRI